MTTFGNIESNIDGNICRASWTQKKIEETKRQKMILAVVTHERSRAFWRRLNFALGKHAKAGSVREVQVKDSHGGVNE